MDRDASLEEFMGSSTDEDTTAGESSDRASTEEDPTDDAEGGPTDDTVDGGVPSAEPASETARWDPDGEACTDCGAVVSERWRDGESFVCGDCKDW